MDSPASFHFAHYEVRRREDGSPWELGRGAMGVTYKAYDPRLRVEVALKVINPAQVGDAKTRALFLREARAAARVHHANVGNVVFLNPDPENMFYAMEFIAGESLRDWMHSRVPLSPLMAIGFSLQIARGLEVIHREDVIHRDLKPTNLMVLRADKLRNEADPDAWLIKIIDFGLARNMAVDVSETSAVAGTTGFRGTALYASPEQCEERRDLDGRADLYSLGCVMWEMLVGAPPFRANVHRELLNAHVVKPPPMQQLSHLPASLQAVVARLLEKDREARFADSGALVQALEKCRDQILHGETAAAAGAMGLTDQNVATTAVLPARVKPGAARWRIVAAAGAALLVFGLLAGWKMGWGGGTAPANDWQARWEAPVIAVLPFDAPDGGRNETRMAETLTNEVINRVAQLPGTRVISRGAVMAFKATPGGQARKRIRAIDAELGGVSAVLESSVERQGDDVKINTVLYDAKTEQRLWGQTFRRDWRDANAAEKEVPEQVARSLRTRLAAARRETPEQRAAGGPSAADLYFQALPLDPFNKDRKPLMDRAIVKDPGFAEAYAESSTYDFNTASVEPNLTPQERAAKWKTVEELNRKALSLDPDCVPALIFLSRLKEDKAEAEAMFRRALQLAPHDFRGNLLAGFAEDRAGHPVEAYDFARRAHAMNPDFGLMVIFLYWKARENGLKELAEHWLKKKRDLTDDMQLRELITIQILIDRQEYLAALDRLKLLPPDLVKDFVSAPELRYRALLGAGKIEDALTELEKTKGNDDPRFLDLSRAEILLRAGRADEARQAAERFSNHQRELIEKAKVSNQPVREAYFRLAKALEILGRQAEATEAIGKYVSQGHFREPYPDTWVFRNNPAALELLAKITEKSDLIAKRILEIEKSYAEPAAGNVPK